MVYISYVIFPVVIDMPTWRCEIFDEKVNEESFNCSLDMIG